MSLQLQRVRLPLERFTLEVDVEFRAPVTVIAGPSGAGKTTLLELVAGLRRAPSARIVLGGRVLADTSTKVAVAVHRRRIGYLPQDLALFPHLNVRGNILYGYRRDASEPRLTPDQVIEILDIAPLLDRPTDAISGGEKQRVALARALLAAPQFLLLDEPLSNLDPELKTRLNRYLCEIKESFGIGMLYVTHDPLEAAGLADEVFALEAGRLRPLETDLSARPS